MSFLYDRDQNVTGTIPSSFTFTPSYGMQVSFSSELTEYTTVDNYFYTMPKGEGEPCIGLYIECGNREGAGVLIDHSGVAELGSIQAGGEDLKIVKRNKRGKEQNPKRVDRQMTFANPAKFRLLLQGPLMEFYLDDILVESFALPANATGRIGLINSAETLGTLKAWE